MLEIDKYVYRAIIFSLCACATATVFGALSIAIKIGDAPMNLSTLGSTLFGFAIALATQAKK